jgi:hypothetical protein
MNLGMACGRKLSRSVRNQYLNNCVNETEGPGAGSFLAVSASSVFFCNGFISVPFSSVGLASGTDMMRAMERDEMGRVVAFLEREMMGISNSVQWIPLHS